MKFKEVKNVPERERMDLKAMIEEFLNSGKNVVEITEFRGNYTGIDSAYISFMNTIRAQSYPCAVKKRTGRLFLVRK